MQEVEVAEGKNIPNEFAIRAFTLTCLVAGGVVGGSECGGVVLTHVGVCVGTGGGRKRNARGGRGHAGRLVSRLVAALFPRQLHRSLHAVRSVYGFRAQ